MTGGFPLLGGVANAQSSGAVQLATPGSANTKGAYTALFTSTTYDAVAMLVILDASYTMGSVNVSYDIAVGASGSEQIIVADLLCGPGSVGASSFHDNVSYYVPVNVPSGSRVSMRCQAGSVSSFDARMCVILFDGNFVQFSGGSLVETIGFSSTTTKGTTATGPSSVGNGTYAQLTASTSNDYFGIMGFIGDQSVTSPADNSIDIAVGASGSEQIIVPTIFVRNDAYGGKVLPFMPIYIPSGTRIAFRVNTIDTSAISIDLTLYGVR